MAENKRCAWCGDDPLYQQYHDREWGVPCRDDQMLFEFVVLEGAQAGLSWITILRKRESYRQAFANFDVRKVAAFDDADVERLLKNPGIVRNRLKVASTISNARHFIDLQNEHGSFRATCSRLDGNSSKYRQQQSSIGNNNPATGASVPRIQNKCSRASHGHLGWRPLSLSKPRMRNSFCLFLCKCLKQLPLV